MKKLRILAVVFLLHLFAASAPAAEVWKTVIDKEGILCSKRDIPDSPLIEIRCVTELAVPMSDAMAVMLDFDTFTEWHPLYKTAKVLARPSPDEWLVYTKTDTTWPVSARDVVDRGILSLEPEELRAVYAFEDTTSALMPPEKGTVRQPLSRGRLLWESIDDGQRTRFTGSQMADPGGLLPVVLVNFISSSLAYDAITAMRARCEKRLGNPTLKARFQVFDTVAATAPVAP